MVENTKSWTLDELYALPQEPQITRLVCVEGWSAIGKWTGTPLREFLRRVGADTRAKYVHFTCAEGYSSSIDMPTALHPQTQLTFKYDGEILQPKYGFPMRVRMPTKLGFKNPKHVIGLAPGRGSLHPILQARSPDVGLAPAEFMEWRPQLNRGLLSSTHCSSFKG